MGMTRTLSLGLTQALHLTLKKIQPMAAQTVDLLTATGRVLAERIVAKVDVPSIDASLKDGYAVVSGAVARASRSHPVTLEFNGVMAAGGNRDICVTPDTTVRVLTGAKIPTGADAVVAEEFTTVGDKTVTIQIGAEPGRNVLNKGSDVRAGEVVARKETLLTPGLVGLLAAAGHSNVDVTRMPHVALLATGDEVVPPGRPLSEGKRYASNITTLEKGFPVFTALKGKSRLRSMAEAEALAAICEGETKLDAGSIVEAQLLT